jgi:OHCU decarboxylase
MSYRIYKNLARLDEVDSDEAIRVLIDCCGSLRWAESMAHERPFHTLERLFDTAEEKWFSLPASDHLEAFGSHPKIGDEKPAAAQAGRAAAWSSDEQSGIGDAVDATRAQLAEVNRLYHEKFGFIFIVCATGKTADEMLAIARARLGNSVETELRLAAEEQNKITRIRLEKLLEQ